MTPQTTFPPFNFDCKAIINILKYFLETFSLIFSPINLSTSIPFLTTSYKSINLYTVFDIFQVLRQSGTICSYKVCCIYYLGSYEGDGTTLQMKRYFSILWFSILLCHIGLVCLFCLNFGFAIIFVTEVFERPSDRDYS